MSDSASGGLRVGAHAPTLELRGVFKNFGPVRALQDISLSFNPGEVLGLLGENGAGKSTLLRILSGDYQPDAGTLIIGGEQLKLRSPAEAHKLGIHVVYQEPELVPFLTVAENLSLGNLPQHAHRVIPREIIDTARALIDDYNFTGTISPTAMVSDCSPAQRQCIEILKAVRSDARVLCLDEPTSSLADDESRRLWALIERLRSRGTSIIYVSHRMSEIQQLCQRVAIMRDGELVKTAPTSELSEDEMIRLMVGRPLSRVFPARNVSRGELVVRMREVTTDKVHEISLDIHSGEIVGLSGLVGSGRSELAHALYGVDRIVSGTIEVAGSPRSIRSPESAIHWGIGLAPEDRKGQGLFLDRSVSDNVSLAILRALSRWHVVDAKAEHKVVSKMTQRMRVKARSLASPVRTLSGGNQQKVLLARWVARNPRVLILDEPTRGIDVGAKAEIYQLINELTVSGMAVLLISSELPELLGLADRIQVMRNGRIVKEVPRKEANEETLLRLALGIK